MILMLFFAPAATSITLSTPTEIRKPIFTSRKNGAIT